MTIKGLHSKIKGDSVAVHLSQFQKWTVGVDILCLLYKGIYSCSVQNSTISPTIRFESYYERYMKMLLEAGVKPIMVLDGGRLPAKAETHAKRRAAQELKITNKQHTDSATSAFIASDDGERILSKSTTPAKRQLANRKRALATRTTGVMASGKPLDNANMHSDAQAPKRKQDGTTTQQTLVMTPSLIRRFINKAREMGVDVIVAPYEADAQLGFMAKHGDIDLVITEDADLLVYRCPRVLFKLQMDGWGQFYDSSLLHKSIGFTSEEFSYELFLNIAVLSGCDYAPNVFGIGICKIIDAVKQCKQKSIQQILRKLQNLHPDNPIPEGFEARYRVAISTFRHQLVFNFKTRTVEPFMPYPEDSTTPHASFAGDYLEPELALQFALGNVVHSTLQPCDDDDAWDLSNADSSSIWSKEYNKTLFPTSPEHTTIQQGNMQNLQEVEWKCHCEESFNAPADLKLHLLKAHNQSQYVCTECNNAWDRRYALIRHMRVHTKEKPFQCNECSRTFSQRSALTVHVKFHLGIGDHQCPECGKYLYSKSNLKSHIKIHNGEKDNMCDICGTRYSEIWNLNHHIRTVHEGQKNFRCNQCPFTTTSNANLQSHNAIHNPNEYHLCAVCGEKFNLLTTLTRHMNNKHNPDRIPAYQCNSCKKSFYSKRDLNVHQQSVHEGLRPFECKECKSAYKTKSNLASHMNRKHNPDRIRAYQCNSCNKIFYNKQDLTGHQKSVHEGLRPFECKECKSTHTTKQKLESHINRKHNPDRIRAYRCNSCNKNFYTTQDLNVHQKRFHKTI